MGQRRPYSCGSGRPGKQPALSAVAAHTAGAAMMVLVGSTCTTSAAVVARGIWGA